MDLRATIGLVLIAVALVLLPMVLTSNGERDRAAFLSFPKQKAEWLRVLLVTLTAYIVGTQLFFRFGYTAPLFQQLDVEVVTIYPVVLLSIGSLVALRVERRLGVVFTIVSMLAIAFLAFNSIHGSPSARTLGITLVLAIQDIPKQRQRRTTYDQ